jgi:putative endonuclease
MASHHELGRIGEAIACKKLQQLGYRILEQNWRYKKAEVDIIAMDGATLVFVEVKTRASSAFGQPEEFVTPQKEALITTAAHAYIDEIDHEWEVRFDIIAIVYRSAADYELRHYEDAFFPGL